MTPLLITLYILSILLCFTGIILYERKKMYIDQEALFAISLSSIVWPLCLAALIIFKVYAWLEEVVNKK